MWLFVYMLKNGRIPENEVLGDEIPGDEIPGGEIQVGENILCRRRYADKK